MKNEKQNVGRRGEDLACRYLENRGHSIIARNWRHSHLELDIVSLEAGTLHFVEVKSRTAPCLTAPQSNVTYWKMNRLVRAAKAFLHSDICRRLPSGTDVAFDVLTVVFDRGTDSVNYIPNAFTPFPNGRFF